MVESSVGITACSMTITTDMVCLFSKALPQQLLHKTVKHKSFTCEPTAFAFRNRSNNYWQHVLVLSVVCFQLNRRNLGYSNSISFLAAICSHC